MKRTDLPLDGAFSVTLQRVGDERGFFLELWREERYGKPIGPAEFLQDSISLSGRDVLRGMHYQIEKPQGHLVTILSGQIYDVGLDLRAESPNFGQWAGCNLSHETSQQVYWPPGIAHGFCVLSDEAMVHYKVTDYYDPSSEGGVLWRDPALGIDWPVRRPKVTVRDREFKVLADIPPVELPKVRASLC